MKACVLVAWFVLVASSVAAQQPGSAGAGRPKLQVLQALPEAQLYPLMNVVAESLGVRCDYCHVQATPDLTRTPANVGGWVWDSDDKPQKKIARDMMKMVVDLNAKNFGGRSRVTCYTCHQGALDPARTTAMPPAAYGSGRTPSSPTLPTIEVVWANYLTAVGSAGTQAPGTQALGTLISGWDDRSEGRYGKFEIVIGGPARYRATVTNGDTTTRQGLDGDVAWVATNDRVTRLSSPLDVARLRANAARHQLLRERPANLQIVRVDRVGDRDVFVARGRVDATTVRTLFFDVVTGLLRREMTTTDTLLVPLQEQVDYDDYRDVGGVKMPFRIVSSSAAPYDTVTRTVVQIRRNVPLEDGLFRPPQ